MKFSPLFCIILAYYLAISVFANFIPFIRLMDFLFPFFLAFFIDKLRRLELFSIASIMTLTIFTEVFRSQDFALSFVPLNLRLTIPIEIQIVAMNIFLPLTFFFMILLEIKIYCWIIKRLKLRERVGRSIH